jgi:hypothetical protein
MGISGGLILSAVAANNILKAGSALQSGVSLSLGTQAVGLATALAVGWNAGRAIYDPQGFETQRQALAGNQVGAYDPNGWPRVTTLDGNPLMSQAGVPDQPRPLNPAYATTPEQLSRWYENRDAYGKDTADNMLAEELYQGGLAPIDAKLFAQNKYLAGVKYDNNGGVDFGNSPYLYQAANGQKNIVTISYSGYRGGDYKAANDAANLSGSLANSYLPPQGYSWHHVNDYNPATNTGTMQLVGRAAHEATYSHIGGVSQYENTQGVKYGTSASTAVARGLNNSIKQP